MNKKFILYIMVLILSVQNLFSQHGVEIHVKDAYTDKALANVAIIKDGKILSRTGAEGKAYLRLDGTSEIILSLQGYRPRTFVLTPGKVSAVSLYLTPETVQLDEIIIVSDPLRMPVHAVVSSDASKKYSQPRNTADLFKDIPGVTLQKRSAMSMEPSLRSFKYEEMNLIYDGGFKMVNACPNRMDPAPAHVIPEEVEKIEIIKGPFNVRFGQSFGAIVNMQTRHTFPARKGWSGMGQAGYETNGNNQVGLASLTYAGEKYFVNTNLSYRNFGDYIDGKNDTVPATFRSTEYSVKAGWKDKRQKLTVDWRQNFTRDVKHAGLPMDSPEDDSYLIGLDYSLERLTGKIKSLGIKSYYSYVDHLMTNGYLMDEPRPNYPTFDARTPVWSRTLGGKIEIEYQPDDNLLFFIGTDVNAIARDGTKTVYITRNPATGVPWPVRTKVLKVWQNAQINDFGWFVQGSWSKNKHHVFGAGVRADYVWSVAKDPDPGMTALYGNFGEKTDITFSANLSYTYKQPGMRFQVALGRGTRTPSMIERYIYRFIIGRDSREYIGNPFLRPEVNHQAEISAVKKWGKWQAGIDLYASYFQDYITARLNSALTPATGSCGNPPRAPKQFVNVNAYQYGFDIYGSYDVAPHWQISADYSYVYAYNISFGEVLAQVNPPGGHVKLKYSKPNYWVDYRVEFRQEKKEVALSFDEMPTPGYAVHDIMMGYKPLQNLTIGLSVTNIFNRAYYYHTTFVFRNAGSKTGQPVYEPGRNIGIMLTYKF